MGVRRKNCKFNRILATFLCMSIIGGIFTTPNIKSYAAVNSNDLRSFYIQMMQGTSASQIKGIETMTADDLRNVSLFLSNFYVPFNSSLDDKENYEEAHNNMVNSLKSVGMKTDVAEALVEASYNASLSSAQQLYVNKNDLKAVFGEWVGAYDINDTDSKPEKSNPRWYIGDSDSKSQYSSYVGEDTGDYTPLTLFTFFSLLSRVGGAGTFYEKSNGKLDHYDAFDSTVSDLIEPYVGHYITEIGTDPNKEEEIETLLRAAGYVAGGATSGKSFDYTKLCNMDERKSDGNFGNVIKDYDYFKKLLQEGGICDDNGIIIFKASDSGETFSASSGEFNVKIYWNNGGSMTECFGINDAVKNFYAAFYAGNDVLTNGNGGNALFSVDLATWEKNLSVSDRAASFIMTQKMYVDWVGNIIVDLGTCRTVVYPGCINPWAFSYISGSSQTTSTDASVTETSAADTSLETDSSSEQNVDISTDTDTNESVAVGDTSTTETTSVSSTGAVTTSSGSLGAITSDSPDFRPYNFVSTWGQFLLTSKIISERAGVSSAVSDTDADTVIDTSSSSKSDSDLIAVINRDVQVAKKKYKFMVTRGTAEVFELEKVKKKGDGGAKFTTTAFSEFMTSIGAEADTSGGWWIFANKDGEATDFTISALSDRITKNKAFTEFLVYKSVTNKNIDVGNSQFIVGDATTSDLGFTECNKFNSVGSGGKNIYLSFSNSAVLQSFFITYTYAYANKGESTYSDTCGVRMRFNDGNFPTTTDTSIVFDNISASDEKITSFIYYLLHPTEGIGYVTTLVKNKLGGILLGWHDDIVGGTSSNSTTGATKYLGFTGYVSSPNLGEIDWMAELLDKYDGMIVFLIIIMCIIMLGYLLTGYMSLVRTIIGVLFFGVLAFIPPIAINTVANTVNKTCDTIYSGKFDYWAYTQLQTYLGKLSNATTTNDVNDYVSQLLELQSGSAGDASYGYSGVKLKWMSPKKVREAETAANEISDKFAKANLSWSAQMATDMLNNVIDGQTFVDATNATYLYRDQLDIYRYGASSYNMLNCYSHNGAATENTYIASSVTDFTDGKNSIANRFQGNARRQLTDEINDDRYEFSYSSGEPFYRFVLGNIEESQNTDGVYGTTSSLSAIRQGFINNNLLDDDAIRVNEIGETTVQIEAEEGKTGGLSDESIIDADARRYNYYTTNGTLAVTLPLTYLNIYNDLYSKKVKLDSFLSENGDTIAISNATLQDQDEYFGLDPKVFNFGLKDLEDNDSDIGDVDDFNDTLSALYFSLYSESPYYYFNAVTRDFATTHMPNYAYSTSSLDRATSLYEMFLQDNQSFFYNLAPSAGTGYGELKDFMNFHDLFYYIIPLMNIGNETARTFADEFGLYKYDDLSLAIGNDGNIHFDGTVNNSVSEIDFSKYDDEVKYKFWHDYNLWCIMQGYTPWVDTLTDCSYAKPCEIPIMGEKFVVNNPLDPTTYFKTDDDGNIIEGRQMIFSKSEMKYYGLDYTDLTPVEQNLLDVSDGIYKESLQLMNYGALADEVLLHSFAMIATFEFNKEFSETSLVGDDFILYPQGYEAKAFTYDSYLRLAVAEASGEPLQTDATSYDNLGTDVSNESIYSRVLKNTSIFFGLFMLINDVIAVYIVPFMKVAFLVMIFFISVALIIAASIKLELNIVDVVWKSIFSPLISYCLISIGFAWIVSLFMSNGPAYVTDTSMTIKLGDPTALIILMIVINIIAMILYFKLCRKCYKDLKTYVLSVLDSISATMMTAGKMIFGGLALRQAYKALSGRFGGSGRSGGFMAPAVAGDGSSVSQNAEQRGIVNQPQPVFAGGGVGGTSLTAAAGGVGGGELAAAAAIGATGGVAAAEYNNLAKAHAESAQADAKLGAAQSRYDAAAGARKKTMLEKAEEKGLAATEKKEAGKAAFNNKGYGLVAKAQGLRDYASGAVSEKYNNAVAGVHKAIGTSKVGRFVFGDSEHHGMNAAQAREYDEAKIGLGSAQVAAEQARAKKAKAMQDYTGAVEKDRTDKIDRQNRAIGAMNNLASAQAEANRRNSREDVKNVKFDIPSIGDKGRTGDVDGALKNMQKNGGHGMTASGIVF